MALPKLNQAYGYELQFFTNHIGHFMMVTGLIEALAADARVTMLSSSAHRFAPKGGIEFDNLSGEKGYAAWRAYGQSKMANLLFAKELARRFSGTARTANALHPGVIFDTNLQRSMTVPRAVLDAVGGLSNLLVLKSIPQGAATQCHVATNPALAAVSGLIFRRLQHRQVARRRRGRLARQAAVGRFGEDCDGAMTIDRSRIALPAATPAKVRKNDYLDSTGTEHG